VVWCANAEGTLLGVFCQFVWSRTQECCVKAVMAGVRDFVALARTLWSVLAKKSIVECEVVMFLSLPPV